VTGEWLLVGMLALGGAGALAWAYAAPRWQASQQRRPGSAKKHSTASPSAPAPAAPPPAAALSVRALQDSADGWLRVVTPQQLLQLMQAERTLGHMLRQSQLAPQVWERDLLAAIHRYADFVQLLPASEAHHHAHAGGLLAHTLEVLLAAMTRRNGTLLPQGAGAEQIDAERDHWTYVVFYAALLHDIGKILCDVRVQWKQKAGAADATRWMPIAGSLSDCGARSYHVGFTPKAERDYAAHQRMAVLLLQRIAPDTARGFMAQQPHALLQLTRFLSGEDRDSKLAEIVRNADQLSTARALSIGSRARFASASSVPLVELLMGAMREMLRRGAALPLNRDGAAAWVFDGSVWFVAKRLADAVRDHLKQHAPDESLPGESKNDRLFDTWQEYGCIVPNPLTQQAVWYVRVHGSDGAGYSHMLTMLRFPLDKLWDSTDQYPTPMSGRIEVLPARSAAATTSPEPAQQSQALPAVEDSAHAGQAAPAPVAELKQAQVASAAGPIESGRPAPVASQPATAAVPLAPAKPEVRAPTFRAPPKKPAPVAAPPERKEGGSMAAPLNQTPIPAAGAAPTPVFIDKVLVDALEDDATSGKSAVLNHARLAVPRAPVPVATTAVVMEPAALPALPGGARTARKVPSPVAIAFMQWLQEGLRTRTIKHNEVGAPVHFVEQGMALVSPLIFREHSRQTNSAATHEPLPPDKLGLDVQREVLKAGWHLPAAAGVNIHQFAVVKKGGIRTGRLSAVVLTTPQRWVLPVPPNNPALITMEQEVRAEARPATGT
jgi:integrating conjugative element relaxase (TIGR03760 family)